MVAGFRYAVRRAALHPRNTLPPSRRVGLRFPPSGGHGRGLATRPGCVGPGEGIDSARRRLHRFRRGVSPRPSRFRLRLRSSMPGERSIPNVSAHFPSSTGSASSVADRITPLLFANLTKCKKKQPPHPKHRAAVAAVAAPPTVSPIFPPSHQR